MSAGTLLKFFILKSLHLILFSYQFSKTNFAGFSELKDRNKKERVTKIENIKTDATKILRPTGFSWSKNIKTDSFFVGLTL